jgi:VanZ family protein
MALIFHLSSNSNPLPLLTENVWDKALHSIEYGGLAWLLCRALIGEGLGWGPGLLLALMAASAYGASDEWHQLYTPGRSADFHDWMADTLGAALGLGAYALMAIAGLTLSPARRGSRRAFE